jgi:hypothetical protein
MLESYFQTLQDVMAAESRLLASVYRHRGKLGENREALLLRFLRTYLPRRFDVGTGFALFDAGVSSQQDIVVYDALNNPVLFPETVAPLFPPSALAAMIEVKSNLTKVELRKTVVKTHRLKRDLRKAFVHHPAPPRTEALVGLFAFGTRGLSLASALGELKAIEEEIDAEVRDRLDIVCVLEQGYILGSSLFYATSMGGQPLVPEAPSIEQQRVAAETENSLFVFYSRLLDYILGRGEIRPQLMSYLPPDTPMGIVVATG